MPVQDQQDRGKDWQVVQQGLLMASERLDASANGCDLYPCHCGQV